MLPLILLTGFDDSQIQELSLFFFLFAIYLLQTFLALCVAASVGARGDHQQKHTD
jgi:hypothetical protein